MTDQQLEALRLARWLEHRSMSGVKPNDLAASTELIRLHADNEALKQQIAATQPAAQGMGAKGFLREADYDDLWRFEGMASDGEGYDISKERMKRLAELGVIRWCGGSRYGVTAFGLYVLKAWQRLPLETYEESNARCNSEFKARIERLNAEAIAAQAKQDK